MELLSKVVVARLFNQDIILLDGEAWQIVHISEGYGRTSVAAYRTATIVKVDATEDTAKDVRLFANQKYLKRVKE